MPTQEPTIDQLWAVAHLFAAASDRALALANRCENARQRSSLLEAAAAQSEEAESLAIRARLREAEALL